MSRFIDLSVTVDDTTLSPPSTNMRAQQLRFDTFQREYNEQRPHEALRQRPPAALYVSSPRPFPGRINEPEYPSWYEVLTPRSWGHVTFRGAEYFLSGALYGERVGLVEIEEDCFEVYFHKVLLGRIHTGHPELGLIAA